MPQSSLRESGYTSELRHFDNFETGVRVDHWMQPECVQQHPIRYCAGSASLCRRGLPDGKLLLTLIPAGP
jgi:hypothetical protein